MTIVDQRIIDKDIGDCFTCCVAALLEIPYEEVPLFVRAQYWYDVHWFESFWRWSTARGIEPHIISCRDPFEGAWAGHEPELVMAGGPSPRGRWGHEVLWNFRQDCLAFDPHPSRAGLGGPPRDFTFFTTIEESAQRGPAIWLLPRTPESQVCQ